MNKLTRLAAQFSSKKSGFFWTEVSPNVLEAEYAVRGVVPTLANTIKEKISAGDKSNNTHIKVSLSIKSPPATLVTLRSSTKNLSLSSGKSWPARHIQLSSIMSPSISTPEPVPNEFSTKSSV